MWCQLPCSNLQGPLLRGPCCGCNGTNCNERCKFCMLRPSVPVSGRIGDPPSPILLRTGDPCVEIGTLKKLYITRSRKHVAAHIWRVTKTGGLLLKKHLLQGVYPSSFSKSDKQALRKRAKFFAVKGAELYYTGRGENQNELQVCNITVFLSSCIKRA